MKLLKYSLLIGQVSLFAGASMAASQYVLPGDITESVDYGSDKVYYKTTMESGPLSMTVGENVSISASGITFQSYSYYEENVLKYVSITSLNFKSGSKLLSSGEYGGITFSSGIDEMISQNTTFESVYTIRVGSSSSWTSSGDTVNVTGGSFYLEGAADFNISNLTLSQAGGDSDGTTFFRGAKVSISDSILNMRGSFNVESGADVTLENTTSTLDVQNFSQVSGANLTIKGGSFKMKQSVGYPESFNIEAGSFVMDGAEVDISSSILNLQGGNNLDTVVTIKNGTKFTAGTIDMYDYDNSQKTDVIFNIEGKSVVNVNNFGSTPTRTDWRGGTINVNDATLNLSTSLIQSEDNGDQVYTAKLNITNGGTANISGDLDVTSVSLDGGNISASTIIVGADRTLSVSGASNVDTDLLKVFENATVSLDEAATLDIGALELVLASELQSGMDFDLSKIFGDDTSIVLAAVGNNLVMSDTLGNSLSAVVTSGGVITAVPEPSTYAAIFGALALAFAAYRRRR